MIKEVLNYQDPHTGSEITIIPSENYEITTMVDFGTKILGTQNASLKIFQILKMKFLPLELLVSFTN